MNNLSHPIKRRNFLKTLMAAGLPLSFSPHLKAMSTLNSTLDLLGEKKPLDLTKSIESYFFISSQMEAKIITRPQDRLFGGHPMPEAHDGMSAFVGANGEILLARNHEIGGGKNAAIPELAYDPEVGGGVSIVRLDQNLQVLGQYWGINGTARNCSGGRTPWNTWVTCEEDVSTFDKPHGYAFEVNPALGVTQKALPLRAMGRFNREAIAVDPVTGEVFQTEDRGESALYRFVPDRPGNLQAGGKLFALKVTNLPSAETQNWDRDFLYQKQSVEWVELSDPESPDDSLRHQAFEKGAAIFRRGEGMAQAHDGIYFSCTEGGKSRCGQVFRLNPMNKTLDLYFVSPEKKILKQPDNLVMSPWGDLIVAEDVNLSSKNRIIGITSEGKTYPIAYSENGEWAGVCFSPDGRVLFANQQVKAHTVAIWGDWQKLRSLAQ